MMEASALVPTGMVASVSGGAPLLARRRVRPTSQTAASRRIVRASSVSSSASASASAAAPHHSDDGVVTVHPITNEGGVTREAFEAVAVEAMNDVYAVGTNPGGFVDLATLESRLLDGYDTSGTGKERPSPTSGVELKTCCAQLLVEGGAGAPWAAAQGWLDAGWVTLLMHRSESEAVEAVVAAALAALAPADEEKDEDGGVNDGESSSEGGCRRRNGVVVIAPFRPAWPSPYGPLSHHGAAAPRVVSVDPAAFGGDVTAALSAAEEFLSEGGGGGGGGGEVGSGGGCDVGCEVGAVVIGNPSPATGVVSPLGDVLKVMQFCQARGAHVVSDETLSPGVFVRSESSAAAAAGAGAGDGPINRRVATKQDGDDDGDDDDKDKDAFGRKAGFISASSLWRKADARAHVVTAFGAGAGLPRGKTSCLLITRDATVRRGAGSDPYANGLQALFGDGGTAAREAFGHHNKMLRRRRGGGGTPPPPPPPPRF